LDAVEESFAENYPDKLRDAGSAGVTYPVNSEIAYEGGGRKLYAAAWSDLRRNPLSNVGGYKTNLDVEEKHGTAKNTLNKPVELRSDEWAEHDREENVTNSPM